MKKNVTKTLRPQDVTFELLDRMPRETLREYARARKISTGHDKDDTIYNILSAGKPNVKVVLS